MKTKFARFALFVIYVWFGTLKILGFSPAGPLVAALLEKTLPIMSAHTFIIMLGIFEVLLGLLFIIPRYSKITKILFAVHMVTTFLPLILLPEIAWEQMGIPTLEGQYIIKNLALIALVFFL